MSQICAELRTRRSAYLSSSVVHQLGHLQRVPSRFAVNDLRRRCDHNSENGAEGEKNGEGKNVGPDDGPRVLCVACEVTDIERERSFGRDGRREGTEEKCRNSVGPGGSAWLGEDWPETIGLRDGPCEHDDAEDRHEDDLQREGREASRY